MFTLADILGTLTVVVALITAGVSIVRFRSDDKTSVVTHFKTLVDTYLKEIERQNTEIEDKNKTITAEREQHKQDIAKLLSNHTQELADCRAEHTAKVAEIQANHTQAVASMQTEHKQELAGLRVALQELRNMYTVGQVPHADI